MDEFSLIQRYFRRGASSYTSSGVHLGIGDDAAVLAVPENHLLVQTIDTLIEGRHFPPGTAASSLAGKALAVNVSDLVAMAATPAYFLLSLSLPDVDEPFLDGFSNGLFEAAERYGIKLVGGDTCRGALSVTIQATGFVTSSAYVTRSGAGVGDAIFVSGQLGSAALGLACLQGQLELDREQRAECLQALNNPQPRLDLLPILSRYASAAIDISDGFLGDLQHILDSSRVGAQLDGSRLPVHPWIREHDAYHYALGGGDDYQIILTVPQSRQAEMREDARLLGLDIHHVGRIVDRGLEITAPHGSQQPLMGLSGIGGFNHFAD